MIASFTFLTNTIEYRKRTFTDAVMPLQILIFNSLYL